MIVNCGSDCKFAFSQFGLSADKSLFSHRDADLRALAGCAFARFDSAVTQEVFFESGAPQACGRRDWSLQDHGRFDSSANRGNCGNPGAAVPALRCCNLAAGLSGGLCSGVRPAMAATDQVLGPLASRLVHLRDLIQVQSILHRASQGLQQSLSTLGRLRWLIAELRLDSGVELQVVRTNVVVLQRVL